MAPIHCRGSIGGEVMEYTFLQICSYEETKLIYILDGLSQVGGILLHQPYSKGAVYFENSIIHLCKQIKNILLYELNYIFLVCCL